MARRVKIESAKYLGDGKVRLRRAGGGSFKYRRFPTEAAARQFMTRFKEES